VAPPFGKIINMRNVPGRRRLAGWLAPRMAAGLLAVTAGGLAAGLMLRLAGAATAADLAWLAVAGCGVGYAC
jgi:hypothetical protein